MENADIIIKGMRLLREGMVRYIVREIENEYGEDWWQKGVLQILREDSRRDLPETIIAVHHANRRKVLDNSAVCARRHEAKSDLPPVYRQTRNAMRMLSMTMGIDDRIGYQFGLMRGNAPRLQKPFAAGSYMFYGHNGHEASLRQQEAFASG